jgi:hypothetical protein
MVKETKKNAIIKMFLLRIQKKLKFFQHHDQK